MLPLDAQDAAADFVLAEVVDALDGPKPRGAPAAPAHPSAAAHAPGAVHGSKPGAGSKVAPAAAGAGAGAGAGSGSGSAAAVSFPQYKAKFGKRYKSALHEKSSSAAFTRNLATIAKLNAGSSGAKAAGAVPHAMLRRLRTDRWHRLASRAPRSRAVPCASV
jgi:hypothetical protein